MLARGLGFVEHRECARCERAALGVDAGPTDVVRTTDRTRLGSGENARLLEDRFGSTHADVDPDSQPGRACVGSGQGLALGDSCPSRIGSRERRLVDNESLKLPVRPLRTQFSLLPAGDLCDSAQMSKPRVAVRASAKVPATSGDAAISRLRKAADESKLIAVIGTGVSIALTDNKVPALAWKGLIQDGFAYGVKKGKIAAPQEQHWKSQIDSSDLDDLLSAAEFMGRKLGSPDGDIYARWLDAAVGSAESTNKEMIRAVQALRAAHIPLCTLNYDHLLERITGLSAITMSEVRKVGAFVRRETDSVLHLHGSYEAPSTCVLGIRDYENALGNEVRDLLQRNIAAFGQLIFIGCGGTFADPNFSALIAWLRKSLGAAAPQHYALVSDGEVSRCNADSAWNGFVEPLSYGATYAALPAFLLELFPPSKAVATRKKAAPIPARSAASTHAILLQTYRQFLLKDCGEMTIEGVRADNDTAQRRFDLERLFVPLKVESCPPDIPENDPLRAKKLAQWQKKNKGPRRFGEVFEARERLALLALPGGGKTLLLKRLAVAYADPARRQRSTDVLPDMDLTPVLIRCREWREHIHRPILTLLENLPGITGRPDLTGLREALLPLFKSGRILLLVDGLDEIHDDAHRSTFVEHLDEFLREHPRTRLVVTSREAGFNLVAPRLANFCQRWRIAPLEEDAITNLCGHWHRLMVADSPAGQAEGREVAEHILRKAPLRRLAENPLLLTMLLVVKHGAGRLPPDRVSLYSRAVEVLLDTWNTKGHEPLNPKEAVPQLAYVAYQMMREGKQTATEEELLSLLQEARDKVPRIRLYARDTPHEFLKRVELRSSLLMEGGYQMERSGMVPFYQFRHLTFQEYLTAVAAVDGHYPEYDKGDTVLAPLSGYLTVDRWKEIIPMAAVLSKKAAEPLMAALVKQGDSLQLDLKTGREFKEKKAWLSFPQKLPSSVARLVECLVEEAEGAPETLTAAFHIVALFARSCSSSEDWAALSRGPYGAGFLQQAWLLYASGNWPDIAALLSTCVRMAAWRQPTIYWQNGKGFEELLRLLRSPNAEDVARGLFTCTGLLWEPWSGRGAVFERDFLELLLPEVEPHLFHKDPTRWAPAAWAWASIQSRREHASQNSPVVLDRLLELWMNGVAPSGVNVISFAFCALQQPRGAWSPALTTEQGQMLRNNIHWGRGVYDHVEFASIVIAFHAPRPDLIADDEIVARILEIKSDHTYVRALTVGITAVLGYLQEPDRKRAGVKRRPRLVGKRSRN
jgi:SIR2-like protein/NACHT domain-containing protein